MAVADVGMEDMALDFTDVDMDPEIARLQAEAEAIDARVETEAMDGVEEAPEEGEIDPSSAALNKVHVRGLDSLNTNDVEAWADEHFPSKLFKKVQWVDDTSANLIYDSEIAATEALDALSAEEVTEPLQLRVAKQLSTRPEIELRVRQAILADVKAPQAKDRSRYYLFNPEWDPDNPSNIRPDRKRKRYEERRHDDRYDFNKSRKRSYDDKPFNVDLYDDNVASGVTTGERVDSYSSGSEYSRRRPRQGEDLFAHRQNGRLRNRSASPNRDGDGRYGFSEIQPRRRAARPRSPIHPVIQSSSNNHGPREPLRKDLFSDKKSTSAFTIGHSNSAMDFVSNPSSPPNGTRELFPDKANGAVHRRQDAKDIDADEVAVAIGKYSIDGVYENRTYNRSGRRPSRDDDQNSLCRGGRDLFARINGATKIESSYGRLQDRPSSQPDDVGFSIKGASRADETVGFTILGASRDKIENPLVKELFPLKTGGNNGDGSKDLFESRIKGRGGAKRRRAEDLF